MADPTRGHVVDGGRLLVYSDQLVAIVARSQATGASKQEVIRRLIDGGLVTWKMRENNEES